MKMELKMKTYAETIDKQSEFAYSYRMNGPYSHMKAAETIAFIYNMTVENVAMDIDTACGGLAEWHENNKIDNNTNNEDKGIWAEN